MRRLLLPFIVAAFVLVPCALIVSRVAADTGTGSISLTTLDAAIPTETFNTLSNTAGSTTNTTLPAGWYITETGGGARDNEQYAVDTGGSTTGDTYSYGSAASTDRALGQLRSGTLIPLYGAKFTNNTGATITSLDVSYTGEQWRFGGVHSTVAERVDFQYSVNATDLSTGTYLDANALDFSPPVTAGTAGALDGNAAANRTAISSTITGLSIPNGATFFIRLNDVDATGADDGLAIDDFSVTPHGAAATPTPTPTPSGPTVSVNDVTQAEGSGGGTTTFNFTVSVSTAQHGGVTLTFSTADGTATTAGNDYQGFSTPVVLPNGSQSITIPVSVNADSTPEPDETFFVNLTNVSGATVADGQGLGTIQNDDINITPIHDIQGNGNTSPLVGQSVTTTGIVTGRKTNGYFIQDPVADADPNTSEAMFVFTSSVPAAAINVGDSVRVAGTVAEFIAATSDEPVSPSEPKTATEITSPTTTILSSGNPLPAPLTESILVAASPSRSAELEKYEYMRVSISSLTVTQPTNNNFGEFWGVTTGTPRPFREPGIEAGDPIPTADEGPHAGATPPNVPIFDGNFERILIDSDDATNTSNTRRAALFVTSGAVVTGIVGPLDYNFDDYRIVLDFGVTAGVTPGITAAIPVPTPTASEFTISHANLENFSSSNATKLNKASLAIRNVLHTPDVVGLIEVDSTASATALANKINADVGNPSAVNYIVHFNDTAATQDIGYLINTARVTVVGTPTPYHPATTFTYCGVTDTLHDRPSYVLNVTFPQQGGGNVPVTIILNHTKSLIAVDSQLPFGTCGTGTEGARNREKRRQQGEDIADLIQSHINENLVFLGDLNAFDFNDGLQDMVGTLKGNPAPANQVVEPSTDRWTYTLTNLINTLPADQRYSFAFEGNAQALDHVLVNTAMLERLTRFSYARYNGDFSNDFATNANTPERVADHDAPVAFFSAAAPNPDLAITKTADRNPAPVEFNFNYHITVTNTGAPASNVIVTDPLPSQVTLTAMTTSQGTCSYEAGTKTVTCTLGTVNTGTPVNIQLTVKPREEGTLNNTATVTTTDIDSNTNNNSASANGIPAIKFVDLAVSKSASANPVFAGENVTYTILVKNINTYVSATGVALTDTLPAAETFVSATTSQGSLVTPPVGSTGTVTANLGTIAVGATATVTITAKTTAGGTVTNSATATSTESEFNPADNTGSASVVVKAAALLKVLLAKQVLTGGCENTTGNVYLTGPAGPGGVTVSLASTVSGASVPASVFIPEGQSVSPAFNVTTSAVAAKQVGTINATLGATTVSRGITINKGSGTCPP